MQLRGVQCSNCSTFGIIADCSSPFTRLVAYMPYLPTCHCFHRTFTQLLVHNACGMLDLSTAAARAWPSPGGRRVARRMADIAEKLLDMARPFLAQRALWRLPGPEPLTAEVQAKRAATAAAGLSGLRLADRRRGAAADRSG